MGFVEGNESDLGLGEEGLGLRNGENVGGVRKIMCVLLKEREIQVKRKQS